MAPPDPGRRQTLALLAAAASALAGCGDPGPRTPESTPPNETGTDPLGPGPGLETPSGNETEPPPAPGTPAPEDVVFAKPNGGEVTATLYGGGDCAVVLVPQVDRDRQSWDQYARDLAEDGYLAMAIDEGTDRKTAGVTAAVNYLRRETVVEAIVLLGASTGGATAVRAAAAHPDAVDGLVTLSAGGGADVADQLSMPARFVVAEGDAQRFVSTAEALATDAPGEDQLLTYDGDAHGQALLESDHADDLRSRLGEFVAGVCEPVTATASPTSTRSSRSNSTATSTPSPADSA